MCCCKKPAWLPNIISNWNSVTSNLQLLLRKGFLFDTELTRFDPEYLIYIYHYYFKSLFLRGTCSFLKKILKRV